MLYSVMNTSYKYYMKTRIWLICFVVAFSLFVALYFFDPLEFMNSFTIPNKADDILMCYYEADLGLSNRKYYIITVEGNIKLYTPNYPSDYEDLVQWNANHKESVAYIEITESIIKKVKKINSEKYISKNTRRYDNAMPEAAYKVVQDTGDGFEMNTIKKYIYNGSLDTDYEVVKKCKSIYTEDICELIDEAVDKVNRCLSKTEY